MRTYRGRIVEIRAGQAGSQSARIACPAGAVPAPGQYLLTRHPAEVDAALALPLFLDEISGGGFLAAPPVPETWSPGIALLLRGPLGRGFRLPAGVKRLALAALGETAARLMPLARQVLSAGGDVTLFADFPILAIPSALEFYPLAALPEALSWADFLAVDLPLSDLSHLHDRLGLLPGTPLPCPGQALVLSPMPCGGLASCGACALPVRRGWKLACEDGPVFELVGLLE